MQEKVSKSRVSYRAKVFPKSTLTYECPNCGYVSFRIIKCPVCGEMLVEKNGKVNV